MKYKVFYIIVLGICVYAGFNIYSHNGKTENRVYEYYELGNSGLIERKGSIGSDKLIIKTNINIEYKDIDISNFVMSKIEPDNFVFSIMDTINEFCKKELCKNYEYLSKGRSNDLEIYHYSNNLHASVYNRDLIYFTIPDEDNRPSQCIYIVTDEKGLKSCRGLDERYYNDKYSKLIAKLVSGHDVDIEYNFDPLLKKFNYVVTFKYGGMYSTIKWFLDFGPDGIFSFVGTNFKTDLANNFQNISFKKSLEYYNENKPGYRLLPELKKGDMDNLDLNEKKEINIKKIGAAIRFYTDLDGKIYLLPYYELYTNKGLYLLLASEKI